MAPYILPESIDRILYLDADIIINGSLHELYEQDFEGAYAAVIKDRFDFCDEVVLQKQKLGMIDSDVYFNSGVMLMNLSVFRENIKLNDIMEFIEEHRDKLFYFDQDILNCLLLEHKKLCDLQYNFQAYPFEKLDLFKAGFVQEYLEYWEEKLHQTGAEGL
ncbi:MAG: glycosyl transferase family 8 [Firmicutes bacterium]|nr:glycosyl transferase family 8 [Bacillota bacterium]